MTSLKGKNILFICPSFFNYEIEIKKKMVEMGANVFLHDERPENNFLTKALIRLNKSLLKKKIDSYYQSIIIQYYCKLDYIFFVNPEAVNESIIKKFKSKFPDTCFVLYMWDSVKNKKNAPKLFPHFDRTYTFDKEDSLTYGLRFRPLFFIDQYKIENEKPIYDLLFIGTAHSDRYELVQKIKSQFNSNIKLKEFYYLSSIFLYLYQVIFVKGFYKIKYSKISYRSLSQDEVIRFVHNSNCIIDINHINQSGLTMRSIEALGSKKKLITTNLDIKNYDFYNINNIAIIERTNPVIPPNFLNHKYQQVSTAIYQKYSLRGWLDEIFNYNI